MAKIFVEHNFYVIFEEFGMYFLEQIRTRSWDYLLHENTFEFYIPSLVQEFYDGFNENNIDRDHGVIEVNWRGELKIVHLQTISELTSISLSESRIKNPENLEDYIHLMGDHCKSAQGGGISAKKTYRNVYALCRGCINMF